VLTGQGFSPSSLAKSQALSEVFLTGGLLLPGSQYKTESGSLHYGFLPKLSYGSATTMTPSRFGGLHKLYSQGM
jgi:hypothetical protein